MNRIVAALLTQPDPIGAAEGLDLKRAVAEELIDSAAGTARSRWASAYPFQDEEYRLAAEEAEACIAAPSAGPFPSLLADVDAGTVDPRTGAAVADTTEAASLIRYTRGLYEDALKTIRAARLGGKAAARTAEDETAIRAAVKIAWPRPASE